MPICAGRVKDGDGIRCGEYVRCPSPAALIHCHAFAGDATSHRALLTIGASVGGRLVIHDRLVTGPDAGIGLLGHSIGSSGTVLDDLNWSSMSA